MFVRGVYGAFACDCFNASSCRCQQLCYLCVVCGAVSICTHGVVRCNSSCATRTPIVCFCGRGMPGTCGEAPAMLESCHCKFVFRFHRQYVVLMMYVFDGSRFYMVCCPSGVYRSVVGPIVRQKGVADMCQKAIVEEKDFP